MENRKPQLDEEEMYFIYRDKVNRELERLGYLFDEEDESYKIKRGGISILVRMDSSFITISCSMFDEMSRLLYSKATMTDRYTLRNIVFDERFALWFEGEVTENCRIIVQEMFFGNKNKA